MAEKSASDISRAIRDQFDKGMAAVHRQNWDYAIAIFNQVLSQEPAFYDCRAALRVAQFKKAGDGPGFIKKFLGPAGRSPGLAKAQMALRSNPLEAIETLEQVLNNDPQNGAAHRLLAEAAQAADLPRTAVLSLEIAFKHNPKDRGLALRLAEALGNIGELNKAEKIYQDLLRANPNDSETAQAYKNLSAKRTLTEGGYDALSEGQGSYRDILRDKEGAITREQEQRQVKPDDVLNRVLTDYEARLKVEPGNFALWRAAAELYAQKKDFTRALEYYQHIANSEAGRDASLERAISETTLSKFDHALAQFDPQNPAHTAEIQALREERARFQLRDAQRLVERYPNDLQLRFELGLLYFETGKISEAIQEFQKSQVSPALRVSSLFYLGQCFARRNMNDLAARSFQNALKEKVVFDDEKKEILYALGMVLENQGHQDQAIEAFKQIYEVDIGFKDVAAKVDRYYTQK